MESASLNSDVDSKVSKSDSESDKIGFIFGGAGGDRSGESA